jgi:Mrr N-terminal domain
MPRCDLVTMTLPCAFPGWQIADTPTRLPSLRRLDTAPPARLPSASRRSSPALTRPRGSSGSDATGQVCRTGARPGLGRIAHVTGRRRSRGSPRRQSRGAIRWAALHKFDGAAGQGIRCPMPIPDYQTLMLPVLRILGDAADHTARSVIDALATEFKLTRQEREQLVGSQRITLLANRAHWAMTYLAQAGLTDRPRPRRLAHHRRRQPAPRDQPRAHRQHHPGPVRRLSELHQAKRGRTRRRRGRSPGKRG